MLSRMLLIAHVTVGAVLALGTTASATTYPVGATRTYHSPCQLAAAVTLAPGDIVEVDAGTYTDACQLTASGSEQAPIVMRGVAGPRPAGDADAVVQLSIRHLHSVELPDVNLLVW